MIQFIAVTKFTDEYISISLPRMNEKFIDFLMSRYPVVVVDLRDIWLN